MAAGQATRIETVLAPTWTPYISVATGALAVGLSETIVIGTVTLSERPWLVPVTRRSYRPAGVPSGMLTCIVVALAVQPIRLDWLSGAVQPDGRLVTVKRTRSKKLTSCATR